MCGTASGVLAQAALSGTGANPLYQYGAIAVQNTRLTNASRSCILLSSIPPPLRWGSSLAEADLCQPGIRRAWAIAAWAIP